MATYCQIKREEMEALLYDELGFPQKHNPLPFNTAGQEIVYGKIYRKGKHVFCLRVYSSLWQSGEIREKGSDAIRVSLLYRLPDGEIKGVGKGKRVHRVKGWRKNLTDRIKVVAQSIETIYYCPQCNLPMAFRKGEYGGFYGCINFPKCKGKRNVEETTKAC